MTLSFLKYIQEIENNIPTMVLVDCDPDGLNIWRCYRRGPLRPGTGIVNMHWLGIRTTQTLQPGAKAPGLIPDYGTTEGSQLSHSSSSQRSGISATATRDPVTQLSQRDRKMAMGMLKRLQDSDSEDGQQLDLMWELRTMLMLGVKAEIQWLDEAGSLTEWLDREMSTCLSGA